MIMKARSLVIESEGISLKRFCTLESGYRMRKVAGRREKLEQDIMLVFHTPSSSSIRRKEEGGSIRRAK